MSQDTEFLFQDYLQSVCPTNILSVSLIIQRVFFFISCPGQVMHASDLQMANK